MIDGALDTTGRNAIGGLSMSATSVLDLAIQAPGLYRGVAAYSGCAMTSAVEAITNFCAQRLRERFAELGIPATFDLRPTGTHSWLYWQDALHTSWPLLHGALSG